METVEEQRSDFWRTAGLLIMGILIGYIIGRFELTDIRFKDDSNGQQKQQNNVAMQTQENATTETETEGGTQTATISADDDPFVGPEDAQITIIEFSDYQCPFSAKFHSEIFPLLEADYIKTGKIKYVFRDFPLNIHPKAQYAHYAAECGKEQNKYWEMSKILFEKQSEWAQAEDLNETFSLYAGEIGINTVKFKECMTSERYRDEIAKDKEDGISYGIKSTPTIVVNGKLVRGITSYEQLKQIIEKEL